MFNLFNTKAQQSKLDVAKAINRKSGNRVVSPYMFKSNFTDEPKTINTTMSMLVCAALAIFSLATGIM